MEFNFSLSRLCLLAFLLMFFFFWGGFSAPVIDPESMLSASRVTRVWFYCVVLYVIGAACVSVVDHFVGTLDRSSLRLLYVILGVIAMASSCLYIHTLKSAGGAGGELRAASVERGLESAGSKIDNHKVGVLSHS